MVKTKLAVKFSEKFVHNIPSEKEFGTEEAE